VAVLLFLMNFAFYSELELLNPPTMKQFLGRIALVVDNYDDAIDFYVRKLKFELLEDTYQPEQEKRWVVVRPPGGGPDNAAILLAEGRGEKQRRFIGNQAGGKVFLFLYTDNFERDYANLLEHKVEIVRPPTGFPYGRVLVFADLYGNLWDLVEPSEGAVM
jgi:catechol 2,3-dioxygenase-like lactoylglutathione lyase family enzyme